MVRTQISVDEELYERAKAVAKLQGVSFAELCRRSLEAAVAKVPAARPWMAYAGVVDGEPGDSSTVDSVVYGRATP